MYGKNSIGQMIEATPGAEASCPGCGADLRPKCGTIKVWHWAHVGDVDCDPWWECETHWHQSWKKILKQEYCEVAIGNHRADIAIPGSMNLTLVIELQHSSISPETIQARETFYKNMFWMFDAAPFADNFELRPQENYFSFRWKHPRQSLFSVNRQMFLDFSFVPYYMDNPVVFHVKKLHPEVPCGGWGYLLSKQEFIDRWLKKYLKG